MVESLIQIWQTQVLPVLMQNAFTIFSSFALIVGVWMLIVSLRVEKNTTRLKQFQFDLEGEKQEKKQQIVESVTVFFDQAFSNDPKEVSRKFLAAGFYNANWAKFFIPAKYTLLILGLAGIVAYNFFMHQPVNQIIVPAALWLVLIIVAPDMYLSMKAKSLTRAISGRLPYLLDLMAVSVQTGMTVEASIRYLSKEMAAFDRDLAYLLNRVNDRANIVGLTVALEEMYQRVPSNEMRSFVMTLNQSLHYGSSIYSVLSTLSGDIREVQLLTIEEKIGKLAAKMSVPLILFIMIPIVILIAAPGVMRMMSNA